MHLQKTEQQSSFLKAADHFRKALLLSTISLFSAVSLAWSQTFTNGDWVYNVTSGVATITKYSGSSLAVSIPSTVSGYTVTSIGSGALNGRSNMISVDIPSTITNIGGGAFGNCGNLRSVVIPSSVQQLGVSAFVGCLQLTDLTIAHGLGTIPAYAFADCPLANVTIAASVTNILPAAPFQGAVGGKFLFLGNAPAGLALGNFPNNFRPYRLPGSSGFPAYIGSNAVQVTSLYTQADPTNGLFTQAQYDANRTNGRADVTNNPAAYSLFTASQYDANRTNGRADVTNDPAAYSLFTAYQYDENRSNGRADVTNNPAAYGLFTQIKYDLNRTNGRNDVIAAPNTYGLFSRTQYDANRTNGRADVTNNPSAYSLYTSNSIMDLRMGGLMVQKGASNAVVTFQPQTTTDLTLPFTNNGTPITNEIPMPGNKGFIRIHANP